MIDLPKEWVIAFDWVNITLVTGVEYAQYATVHL